MVNLLITTALLLLTNALSVSAQTNILNAEITPVEISATEAAVIASTSANIASPSAETVQKIKDIQEDDITVTDPNPDAAKTSKLTAFLNNNPPGNLSWSNFIQHAIRSAVKDGVPANVIVLVLLFPLIASLIAASRHIIGLRGFGIYIPTVLSVAFVSTGILEGIILFIAIATAAMLARRLISQAKLSYLPRTALLMWTISLGILSLLLIAPIFNMINLVTLNIFPILILVLLTENFLDALGRTKASDAWFLILETFGLAFISSLLLRWEPMQRFALTEPELLIFSVALINVTVGKFTGLRITELLRFRSIIEE